MSFLSLLRKRPLLLFALTMACFHLGNVATLPMAELFIGEEGSSTGSWLSAAIVITGLTMFPLAILATRVAERQGYHRTGIAALLVLRFTARSLHSCRPAGASSRCWAWTNRCRPPGRADARPRIVEHGGHRPLGCRARRGHDRSGPGRAFSSTIGGWHAREAGYAAAFAVLGATTVLAIPIFLAVGMEEPDAVSSRAAADGRTRTAPADASPA